MSEFVLDTSETRPSRAAAAPEGRSPLFRPIVLTGICAAILAGFAVAASSVMADLVVPAKTLQGPSIDKGLASSWPDLKDGLPAKAGVVVVTTSKSEPAPDAPAPRMAALPDPVTFAAGKPAAPPAVAAIPSAPQRPVERIPVATEIAVVTNASAAKVVGPGRTVAVLSPRPSETVRARDEVAQPMEAAAKAPHEAAHSIREAVAEKPGPTHTAGKARASFAKPSPEPKIAAAKPAPDAAKVAAAKLAPKPTMAVKPVVTHTATAEDADTEETEILGVKLPSLAPAGRKLKEGVSALGEAVRSAF